MKWEKKTPLHKWLKRTQPTCPSTPESRHWVPHLSPLNSLWLPPAYTSLQMNGQRLSLSGFGRRSRLGVIKALCGANCWLNADSQQPPPPDRTPLTPPPPTPPGSCGSHAALPHGIAGGGRTARVQHYSGSQSGEVRGFREDKNRKASRLEYQQPSSAPSEWLHLSVLRGMCKMREDTRDPCWKRSARTCLGWWSDSHH